MNKLLKHRLPMKPRDPSEPHRASTQLELFFDLCAVIAIAKVTASFHHSMSEGLGFSHIINYVFMFTAIWWAWVNYTWFATAYDNGDAVFRTLTMVIMAGFLIFAGGIDFIYEHLDFSFGVGAWIIMRIGLITLWIRAYLHNKGPDGIVCLRNAIGLAVAQLAWIALVFFVETGSAQFTIIGSLIFLIEFSVPFWAGRNNRFIWHKSHIIERYGLLNIIVLGEALLSISFAFSLFYQEHFKLHTVIDGVAMVVSVFAIWWLYFMAEPELDEQDKPALATWAFGHWVVFFAGSFIGASLSAYVDVLSHHSKITLHSATIIIAAAFAIYLLGLWLIRERSIVNGIGAYILPIGAVALLLAAYFGAGLVAVPIILLATVYARMKLSDS